ncbi:MAG: EAL domain-containing protein [Lachnospiraceae bacterium]|nr:EAL domain-containing protein [Lachnospiraceae bacterium]
MVWNVHFQFAALTIAVVVAVMCFGQKRLNFAAERAFTKLLFCVIVSIILDLSSIAAINYRNIIGENITQLVCKLYLFSITAVACQAAWFSVAEIRYTFKQFWVNATAVPLFIEAAVLLFVPVNIYVEGKELYTYGIPVLLTYAFCTLYILSTFVMILTLRDKINLKRRYAIYFWMIAWLVAALIQFINNELLVVSLAMAIGCMYMYCKLENPEYHLDFATNVFNRKGFEMIMSEHLKYKERKALISMVIRDMNMVNEVFGTHAVETVILSISKFAENIPDSTLFRLEDNLFCIALDKPDDSEKALEYIIKRFEIPWNIEDASLEIGVSLTYIEDTLKFKTVDDLEEVVHYFAGESLKRPHGDILTVNEEELSVRQRSMEIRHAIEWALHNDSIEVYYQPIYNIREGRFSSMEALIRIRDDKGSMVMPSDFIEYAEKNGMILKLGESVFKKVCEFIQRMHVDEYGIEYIEVNLSVVQCMQTDMARILKNVMGEYQIPPYRINFEITETATGSSKAIDKNMRELLDYGCSFSLDDYGSGYSNLTYVVNLPLKIIKIDKLITDSYFTSEKVRVATEYTIEMLHKLGMEIVVEGVDSEEKYLAFKKLNAEYIQGYYFSKPLPKDRVLNFIQEWL